jgi:hypothetical protein
VLGLVILHARAAQKHRAGGETQGDIALESECAGEESARGKVDYSAAGRIGGVDGLLNRGSVESAAVPDSAVSGDVEIGGGE